MMQNVLDELTERTLESSPNVLLLTELHNDLFNRA